MVRQSAPHGTSYRVKLEPSAHSFEVQPGETVLEAGLAAGLFLPYSCRSGVCSTCRGRVLAGEVNHGKVHPNYSSAAERAAGYTLLCQARPLSDLVIEARELTDAEAIKPRKHPARIKQITRVAPDIAIVTLRLPMNEPMLFRAGQYVEFVLSNGSRRAYSIANAPAVEGNVDLELHLRHVPGGAWTDYVFTDLRERELVKIEGPLGGTALRSHPGKLILLASGTGFAPIKSIIEDAARRNASRPMMLYWGGRTRQDLYLADLAASWVRKYPWLQFTPVLSDATPDCEWTGRTGFVHHAVMDDLQDLSGYEVYACGAPIMIQAARADFIAHRRLNASRFSADAFLTEADKNLSVSEQSAAAEKELSP